ncbi:MAG: hypothetical protein K6B71_00235 [Alphaproteobacteria bacterium]|nr:hypothetical protein [Alphaproteobacteria bacterium]
MKKVLGIAVAAATMVTGAASAGVTTNMENPLFIPRAGQFASKTGVGLMYKKADHTDAMKLKNRDGAEEFPIWRFTEDFSFGITDRLNTYVSLGWTQNDDIDRKGMHRGRIGLDYRLIETLDNFIWDMYGEAYLSGVSPMKGSVKLTSGKINFKYDNFSNGRWGAVLGTKIGKTWSRFTASLFAEYLQTFGNHNNEIDTSALASMGFPDEISVNLKSTAEITVGTNAFYQINRDWSFGGGFRFVEHTDNGVKSVHTKNVVGADALVANTKNMHDGWDEYILSAVVANQITDSFQIALVGEYTFDHAHKNSVNGTDVKAELGVRFNVKF